MYYLDEKLTWLTRRMRGYCQKSKAHQCLSVRRISNFPTLRVLSPPSPAPLGFSRLKRVNNKMIRQAGRQHQLHTETLDKKKKKHTRSELWPFVADNGRSTAGHERDCCVVGTIRSEIASINFSYFHNCLRFIVSTPSASRVLAPSLWKLCSADNFCHGNRINVIRYHIQSGVLIYEQKIPKGVKIAD